MNDKKPQVIIPENTIVDHDFERLLKSFLKQTLKDGILEEVRERRCYYKKSEIKHKIEGARKRKQKLERRKKRSKK